MAKDADPAKSRVQQRRAERLQGVALCRSSFTTAKGLASPKVDALLGFSSSGVSPSWWCLSPSRGAPLLRFRQPRHRFLLHKSLAALPR
jgi:hypothetical protein